MAVCDFCCDINVSLSSVPITKSYSFDVLNVVFFLLLLIAAVFLIRRWSRKRGSNRSLSNHTAANGKSEKHKNDVEEGEAKERQLSRHEKLKEEYKKISKQVEPTIIIEFYFYWLQCLFVWSLLHIIVLFLPT
jgi:Flp pilus assembly protein TadB